MGDTANTMRLACPNHAGSHVDAPLHFIDGGRSILDYEAGDWVFEAPVVLDVPTAEACLVGVPALEEAWTTAATEADLILLRTGAQQWRGTDVYWERGPGLSPSAAVWLCDRAGDMTAIGLDTISLNSFQHRPAGREAHRILLGRGVRIFEDLDLAVVPDEASLVGVVALPLRLSNGDGAPTTVLGVLGDPRGDH